MKKEVILFGVVFSILSFSASADCSTTGLEICGTRYNCLNNLDQIQSIWGFETYCNDRGCPVTGPPPCSPNCNCASTICQGETCSNGCGGTCPGTKDCSTPPPPPPPAPPLPPGIPSGYPTVDGHLIDACYDDGSGVDCGRKYDSAGVYCNLLGYPYASSFTEAYDASSMGGTIYLPVRMVCSECGAYFTSISCGYNPPCIPNCNCASTTCQENTCSDTCGGSCQGAKDCSPPPCTPNTYYRDSDSDGYGNPSLPTSSCTQPAGYVSNNYDCDDSSSAIKPGAAEICNDNKDNDCNGKTDGNRGANSDAACCIFKGTGEDWCNINSLGNLVSSSREIGNCNGIKNEGCDSDGDGYINYRRIDSGKLFRSG